jgi:murein DD-endopeptidase MepM/ murein hydrolase activator NlpD
MAVSARMNGRTVPLFPRNETPRTGLMGVPATEAPGTYMLEFLDSAGQALHTETITVRDARFRRDNVRVSKEVATLEPSPGEMETVRAMRRTVSDTKHWSAPFVRPVAGCMTSPFGVMRLHNGKPTGNFHDGIDQRSAAGTPIRALAAGTAGLVRMFNIHGGTVAIDHGQGLITMYLHMSSFAVKEGAAVKAGEIIGYAGSTGRSTAPHLHWSIYVHGVPVNPQSWVRSAPCGTPAKRPARKKKRGV